MHRDSFRVYIWFVFIVLIIRGHSSIIQAEHQNSLVGSVYVYRPVHTDADTIQADSIIKLELIRHTLSKCENDDATRACKTK